MNSKTVIILWSILYLGSLFFIRFFGVYQTLYGLGWFFASFFYLLLAHFILNARRLPLPSLGRVGSYVVLFLIGFLLRSVFFTSESLLSRDVQGYYNAGMLGLQGIPPYSGPLILSYPPLAYLAFSSILILYPSILSLKFFFIVFDSLIPLLIFELWAILFRSNRRGFSAAVLYAINPLPIIEVGWSGHYDPLPTFLVLASAILLFKRKYPASAVLLGLSAMLKWYPLVLLPIYVGFVFRREKLKSALVFLFFFFGVCFLSVLAMFRVFSPDYAFVLMNLVSSGGDFFYSKSLSDNIGRLADFIGFSFVNVRHLVSMSLLFFCFLALLYNAYSPSPKLRRLCLLLVLALLAGHLTLFFSMTLVSLVLGLGSLSAHAKQYALFFSLLALYRIPDLIKHIQSRPETDAELPEFFVFGITLVILALPAFSPWYFTWLIPWILLVEDRRLSLILLWVFLFLQPVAYQSLYDHFTAFSV